MGRRLRLIFSVLLFACIAEVAWCEVDSVMKVIRSLPIDTIRLHELEKWMRKTLDTPDELIVLDSLFSEATRQKNIEYQSLYYRNKVRYYYNADNLEMAKIAVGPAVSFFRKHKLYSRLFEVESMVVMLYTNRQEYEFSFQMGAKMYKEAELLHNSEGMASACYALAYACYASGRHQEAISWNRKGLELVHRMSDYQNLMEFNFLLAESSLSLSKFNDMHAYLDSTRLLLNEYEKVNAGRVERRYSYYWLWLNCRYAYYYLQQGDLTQARIYLDSAANYLDDHSYNIYRDLYHFAWSDYYLLFDDFEKAMDEVEKGNQFYLQSYSGQTQNAEVFQRRAKIYAREGKYLLATDQIKKAIHISDSLNNIRFADQSRQLRTIYEMSDLETEEKERVSVIRLQTTLAIFLGMMVCLLCYFFFRFLHVKRWAAGAALRAKEADQNTSLFLANMGREVKVFLQEMSALSDSLIYSEEQEKRREYAETICVRNEKAQKVIFDILDVSKIDSKRIQFHYENVVLNEFANMILFNLREHTPENVTLVFDGGEETLFVTDSFRLNQILTNLLYYAVTHSGAGNLHLGYEMKEQTVSFYIVGEGWTMSELECNALFDRVLLTSGNLENMHLGMIIARGLIEGMGGELSVFYYPDGGSRFEFVMPKRTLSNNE